MRWTALRIAVNADDSSAEAAANMLVSAGCAGVAHSIGAHDEVTSVTGYLPEDERLAASIRSLETALLMLPSIGVSGVASELLITSIDEEDWANSWKQYFKPIRIGRKLVVSPPWESPDLSDQDILITIDPGMAFGTGTHPTTQMCLAALEDYIERAKMPAVADIGTGSGILAIAAKKLGARSVAAVDIDPLAVSIAAANCSINRVEVDVGSELDFAARYDVLVANILAEPLIALAEHFARCVIPGGFYIASGIIEGREDDVRLFTEAEGFIPLETRRQGEWVALVFRRAQA